MGCWPIAGMTSLDVTEANSLSTLCAALDAGVNHFDTAFAYGADGESERLIARALGHRRDEIVIATKGGIAWDADGGRILDARPATLRRQCDESLRRLNTDRAELLYLHAPDGKTPIAESAGELQRLQAAGKTRTVGASNLSLPQLKEFAAACPLAAIQPNYNMLQRDIETGIVPWCVENNVSILVYWPLLKGLLAGKLPRDHVFAERDGRRKYSQFQGEEWQRNHDLLDKLRAIAADAGRTLPQLVINWTVHQPGITAALCGAKRPEQIRETAGALDWSLTDEQHAAIERALAERGKPAEMSAV
jgi:aryl-alcohol dehydrogenase-like predicted oxidoreductase